MIFARFPLVSEHFPDFFLTGKLLKQLFYIAGNILVSEIVGQQLINRKYSDRGSVFIPALRGNIKKADQIDLIAEEVYTERVWI